MTKTEALGMTKTEALELTTAATAPDVLRRLGLVPDGTPVEVAALSGGISNVVLAATWVGGTAVLNQSLPKLRVGGEWMFDRSRIHNERRAMELPAGSVPSVLAHDDDAFLFVMSHAPAGGVHWKDALLAGTIDAGDAGRVGGLLGAIHASTADDPDVARTFADLTPMEQGRIDPYHRTTGAGREDAPYAGAAAPALGSPS